MEFSKTPGSTFPAPRRNFTAPTYSTAPQPAASSSQSADGVVDTLYDHPSAKIVAFTAGPRVSFGPKYGITAPEVEPGSLSWSSQLERTIAVGPFRIYRAPGSVAFLSCGSALQPILPKSQVWCVDEASSKFVLQVRRPQYWRIEIPVADSEDVRRAQLLREVFGEVLQFEKTECPFKRTFTVELPERPQTPVKKRPWTPVHRPRASLPPTPVTPIEKGRLLRKSSLFEELRTSSPEPTTPAALSVPERSPTKTSRHSWSPSKDLWTEKREDTHDVQKIPRDEEISPKTAPTEILVQPTPLRLNGFQASRSVVAPPELNLSTSTSPELAAVEGSADPVVEVPLSQSPADSQDSFHSVQSWHSSPLPPSPPPSNPGTPMGFPFSEGAAAPAAEETVQQDVSQINLMSNDTTHSTWDDHHDSHSQIGTMTYDSSSSVTATAPPSVLDGAETSSTCDTSIAEETEQSGSEATGSSSETPPSEPTAIPLHPISTTGTSSSMATATRRPQIRHRATTSSSISPTRLSPLPPAANLFTSHNRQSYAHAQSRERNPSPSKLAVVRRLPMQVIHKTCEILMSPPSHLINIMLKVAARIAAGEWRGFVFGTGEKGEEIPVQWDWSDSEEDGGSDFHQDSYTKYRGQHQRHPRQQVIRRAASFSPWTRGHKMVGSFPESESDLDDSDGDDDVDVEEGSTSTRFADTKTGVKRAVEVRGEGKERKDGKEGKDVGNVVQGEEEEGSDERLKERKREGLGDRDTGEESDWSRSLGVD
ncbi:inheritance of peroxisomes protein 1-domain-containing protein [Diplogelasinospora grovesii]|uniref:Inheritance of peroxisomes protein 1 n=1 Tax=Diplogelasinospora grovesii TaxID=303347 RepID=A0AAN6N3U3_9PEZI|nr:inheritance of peroxisomes protein 1-domain-containing protein [Diplogelasinospora grovesii]